MSVDFFDPNRMYLCTQFLNYKAKMSANVVRVGLGVFLQRFRGGNRETRELLVGRRKSSHGAGDLVSQSGPKPVSCVLTRITNVRAL